MSNWNKYDVISKIFVIIALLALLTPISMGVYSISTGYKFSILIIIFVLLGSIGLCYGALWAADYYANKAYHCQIEPWKC